jgi:hypothetical protein
MTGWMSSNNPSSPGSKANADGSAMYSTSIVVSKSQQQMKFSLWDGCLER